ncbi:MAG: D-amino-acid transaminase [Pseudomonadota bacterium]
MSRIAYANGQYTPITAPVIQLEDRGYQFADGVYEVCLVVNNTLWDADGHFARLERSLAALEIDYPVQRGVVETIMREVLRRNRLRSGLVYLQVTRGVASRNHQFPGPRTPPVLSITAKPYDLASNDRLAQKGVAAVTVEDIRWGRVDIKSISLLPNALAKQAAKEAGAFEAILLREGIVTEGSSTNVWIATRDGVLRTHPLGNRILGGITRHSVLHAAQDAQIPVVEEAFSQEEAQEAAEMFVTSATSLVMPVVRLDGESIGTGKPGPMATKLRAAYKTIAAPARAS